MGILISSILQKKTGFPYHQDVDYKYGHKGTACQNTQNHNFYTCSAASHIMKHTKCHADKTSGRGDYRNQKSPYISGRHTLLHIRFYPSFMFFFQQLFHFLNTLYMYSVCSIMKNLQSFYIDRILPNQHRHNQTDRNTIPIIPNVFLPCLTFQFFSCPHSGCLRIFCVHRLSMYLFYFTKTPGPWQV